ncbi:hypothetical protein LRR81_19265 [Metabacillus sp. GX 13764]|uniref:hypothetical protein n=1 Tax=Metabacillus kandeliae TaxID=2900151 RepID=UPI001E47F6CA|nr:hypothetical protein [Metabacillus kandeliae]MCD7036390.1 hypothetical protein [Metabacillus kandeliae]
MAEKTDFPKGIGKPAIRALNGAGFEYLEQLEKTTEAELKKLHGMGPKALGRLKAAMEEKGLSFTESP